MFDVKGELDSETNSGRADVTASAKDRPRKPVVLVLHQEHSNPGHIGQWFVRNGYPLDIRRPRFGDPLPATLEHHCGAVILGGPMSANDPEEFIKIETEWIGVPLLEKKPFFGICLGAQLLARLLGARVYLHPNEEVEIGYYGILPTGPCSRLEAWPEYVYEWHKEGFDIPAGATVLARSSGAFPNQAFAYGHAAFAVQFHPEITFAQVHRWTGRSPQRLACKGARPRHEHIEGHIAHAPKVQVWLDRFLRQWAKNEITVA
jgi:GMP synthase (glutamine-hydrolysing)